ncbi:MAG: sigma-70 family RNA polymerase sigma factor [Pirellulaceae bacterium]
MTEPLKSDGKIATDASDHSLLGRLRSGDSDAAHSLYMRYARRLLSLAHHRTSAELATRIDPEDIVQSVFRTFFRRASAGQYDVPEGEELWKLLLVIALNKVRAQGNFHRAGRRDVSRTQTFPADSGDASEHTDQRLAEQILQMSIDEIVVQLPESSRQIVRMRIEGYAIQEIADKLKRSKRTIERVLQGFRAELLSSIGESGQE